MTHATFCILAASIALLCLVVIGLAKLLTLIADEDDWS